MATRYGYDKAIGLTGPLSVNWQELTNSTVNYLNEIQEKKDTEKKEIAKEARDIAVKLSENPFDYTSSMYGFYGKAANGAINLFGGIEKDYADRKISKTERDIKMANGKSQMEQYISASTLFAQQEKERAKKSGPNGTYGAEDIFENEILSSALDYENIEPMWDPDSATFNALVTFNDGTKRIMSSNQLYRTTQREEIGEYDMNKNIKEQFETIGVKTKESADGSIITGDFVTKQGEEADNALRNMAQAMISQPVQLRSMLSTYPISVEEEGKVNTYKFSREFLPQKAYDIGGNIKQEVLKELQDQNPTVFYRDTQGNYYESDRAKEIGEKYAMERLMLAADYKEKEAKGEGIGDKITKVALYGKKVPDSFIKDYLTPDEYKSYTKFINKVGGADAILKLSTSLYDLVNIADEDLKDTDKLKNKISSLGDVAITTEIKTSGYFGTGVPDTIELNALGADGLPLTVELYDTNGNLKSSAKVRAEIVNKLPKLRDIEDINFDLKFSENVESLGQTPTPVTTDTPIKNIPPLMDWMRLPENVGKTAVDYMEEFNITPQN